MDSRSQVWTVGKTLSWMSDRFGEVTDTARLDAQVLLGHATGLSRVELYMHFEKPLTLPERETLRSLVKRRLGGEPVAYIVGHKEWLDMDLLVDQRVLIPRPETETLFDLAARWLEADSIHTDGRDSFWIIDLCTGSGCLALAFARRFPNCRVTGVDVSHEALEIAKRNSIRWSNRVEWQYGDVLCATFWKNLSVAMHSRLPSGVMIVGNPPYVSEEEFKACELGVREFEPKIALVAPDNGLAFVSFITQKWMELCEHYPHMTCLLALEAAEGQPRTVIENQISCVVGSDEPTSPSALDDVKSFPASGFFVCADLDGKERFLMGRSKNREHNPS